MKARYSRNSGYTITTRAPRRPSVRTVQRKVKFGPTTAKVIGFFILMILGIVTLTQATTNATSGYSQAALRKEISKKKQDIDQLELENQRAQSLQAIEQSKAKDGLEPVKDVEFVEEGQVAGVSTTKTTPTPQP